MSRLVIGSTNGKAIAFDLDILVRTRLLIQADSGGGKSWLIRKIAEQAFDKIQVILIDPEGEFATLREKFDFVLVGKDGETPADPRSAALVAHRLLELRASAVCDLYELKSHLRHEWVKLFLNAMIDAPKNLWRPVLVIVDEAHVYCPEKDESAAAGAMIDLATRGRKRGFCAVFATQRLAKLDKDASSELQNRLIGPTFEDVNRKRAAEVLGILESDKREFFHKIQMLEPGNFYALGRAISTERILVKIGSVQTSHPEMGSSKHATAAPPAPEKIKALLPKLADLPKEADEKARTEADYKRIIADLRRQLTMAAKPAAAAPTADPRWIQTEIRKRTEPLIRQLESFQRSARQAIEQFRKAAAPLNLIATAALPGIPTVAIAAPSLRSPAPPGAVLPQAPVSRPAVTQTVRTAPVHADPRPARPVDDGDLAKGERLVLMAIAGDSDGLDRSEITLISGYKKSTRDAYLQRLQNKGMIAQNGSGKILATPAGVEALGPDYEPLPTGSGLLAHWLNKLPEGEKKVLQAVVDFWPEDVSRDQISEISGYQKSTRDAYIQRLAARRLIDPIGRGQVKAAVRLFDAA